MIYTIARAPILPLPEWRAFTADLAPVLAHINLSRPTDPINPLRRIVYGPGGVGNPILTDEEVIFNGNVHTNRWFRQHPDPNIPEEERDDAHEDFLLRRLADSPPATGFQYNETITHGKPYALAVRAALILARHHFPTDTFIATAQATAEEWERALRYVRRAVPTIALPCVRAAPTSREARRPPLARARRAGMQPEQNRSAAPWARASPLTPGP